MEIEIHKISKKLKNLREAKKLTQEELAKNLGVSRQSIISLEQGRSLPSLPLALSFTEIFDLPFEQIFCEEINRFRREVNSMTQDLGPWSPLREISSLHEAIDRLFEENISSGKSISMPLVNVSERGKNIVVCADLPGVQEEDISIEVGDETITISGERKSEEEHKDKDYYHKEVNYGSFSRTIPLPALINKDKAEATLKNGTLVITVAKVEKVTPKAIKIKVKKS